jgi:tRNA modification GTPase
MRDEGILLYFKKGASYTGEDVVELQLHGSPTVLVMVVRACATLGARLAEPGEFTKRAFLHGRIDLTQAQAVADLIAAQSAASARLAGVQLRGGLADRIRPMRERLLQLLAQIEAGINFPQDEIEEVKPRVLHKNVRWCVGELEKLLAGSQHGIRIREGARVALVGLPNAGKSSLFNALLATERSIVTPLPGTTRDTIEEVLEIDGIAYVVSDTAGITTSDNTIEQLGVERSIRAIKGADIVVVVLDAARRQTIETFIAQLDHQLQQVLRSKEVIRVGNKLDLLKPHATKNRMAYDVMVSAKTQRGLQSLRCALGTCVVKDHIAWEHVVVSNARQVALLRAARDILADLKRAQLTSDCLSLELERAVKLLGEITGEDASEDVIERIFSQFCVGK